MLAFTTAYYRFAAGTPPTNSSLRGAAPPTARACQALQPIAAPDFEPDYELVLSGLLEAVVVLSEEGTITHLNQAAETLLERSRASVLGQSLESVLPDASWIADLAAGVHPQHTASSREGEILHPNGQRKAIVAEATLLRDRVGGVAGVVLFLHDEHRLGSLRSRDRDRSAAAALHRLAGQLAHEINNPLSGIRGAAQLLGNKADDPQKAREYSAMIVRQADRVAELVSALMSLEAPVARREPVNIHRPLREVLLLEKAAAQRHGVAIHTAFDPSLPDVEGDPDQLQQVFLNVVKNAVAACPDQDGTISILTRMEHGFHIEHADTRVRYISVEITDNGCGLDQETITQMFTPLFSRTKGGHGMGLTVAHSIIASHEGMIRAENTADGGARIRITLPVLTDPGSVDGQPDNQPEGQSDGPSNGHPNGHPDGQSDNQPEGQSDGPSNGPSNGHPGQAQANGNGTVAESQA